MLRCLKAHIGSTVLRRAAEITSSVLFHTHLIRSTQLSNMLQVSCYLEAVESNEEPQDVVCALENSENSQIPHHSFHSSVLWKQTKDDVRTVYPKLHFSLRAHVCNKYKAIIRLSYFRTTRGAALKRNRGLMKSLFLSFLGEMKH